MNSRPPSTRTGKNRAKIRRNLSDEQIDFAKVVGRALAEAWLRECRTCAEAATGDSAEIIPLDSKER